MNRVYVALLAWASAGCGATGEADSVAGAGEVLRIDAARIAELEPGQAWLADLSQPENVLVIDQTAGLVDRTRIWIVCPNAMQMALDRWLVLQDARFQAIFDSELVAVSLTAGLAEEELPPEDSCPNVCWTCSDGATACGPSCGPGEGSGGTRSEPLDPDLEPPNNHREEPPPDPPPSSPVPSPGDGDPPPSP